MYSVFNAGERDDKLYIMPDGLLYLLIFIALVIVYTIAKVLQYQRRSQQQWEQVDKSKLKEWDDDEDW